MVGWHAQFFGGMELGRVLLFKKLQSPGTRVSAVLFWKSFSGSQASIFCNDVEIANKKTPVHLNSSIQKCVRKTVRVAKRENFRGA